MPFSVALCTYNGAEYIVEQLRSIVNGSIAPNQIVVCDDRSSDGTAQIITEFAASCSVPIELHINDTNLGYVRNFEKAILFCREPIIFLSDQDDVWLPNKAAAILARFNDPAIGGVFSDAALANADLSPMGMTMFSRLLSVKHRRRLLSGDPDAVFSFLLTRPIVTGATLAVRRSLIEDILPFPDSRFFIHDGWLALGIASLSILDVVKQPLIFYRQHSLQQIGLPNKGGSEADHRPRYPTLRRDYTRLYGEISIFLQHPDIRPGARRILLEAVRHNDLRLSLFKRRFSRPLAILGDLLNGRYGRYSSGMLSAARDLIRPQC